MNILKARPINSNFYSTLNNNPMISNCEVKDTIQSLIQEGKLSQSAIHLRVYDSNVGQSSLYLLSKIHKTNSLHPIASTCSCPTVHIEFWDTLFQPMITEFSLFIKDTNKTFNTCRPVGLLWGSGQILSLLHFRYILFVNLLLILMA